MADAVVCRGLVKRYGDVVALDGLDLTVPAGAIFGFLGPNGAGKTTTVRLLTGLTRPTAGSASVAGLDVLASGLALRRRISYLAQQPELYGWMRGRELLGFVGELFGLRGAPLRARVDEVLEQTGLTEAANRRVGGYSGGMRQRLGLAQALVNQPEVLFLDEPVSSLDPAGRHEILGIIAALRDHATVFMSTHILADVERVCDRVAIIDRGRLVVASTVADLQERYAQPVFLLEPEPGQAAPVAALRARLAAQPWVASLTVEGETLRVVASRPAEAAAGILPLVVATGVTLARFERGRPSLEDIFLRLVGEREAAATEAVR
ncbi:MAG TPA: ABC transporter ATP-binding protein [Thermomicrobiaceae bacterium]|nr:ABC transporter ATP-binding protein [Thermomicrobiaceae bacterium]